MDLYNKIRKLSLNKLLGILHRGIHFGFCPICEKNTLFFKSEKWLRDHYHCFRCFSIPRQRAIIHVLQTYFPDWRKLDIHESSPNGPTFDKLASECQNYTPTQYFPEQQNGTIHQGFRSEDLSEQTFADESFDIVITQDVLEHLLNPVHALKEISRTLKPGGVHIFTVPWYSHQPTKIRVRSENGELEYLERPDYHSNPINEKGSLVVTEWGEDLIDTIYLSSGMQTTVINLNIKHLGIRAKFIEVFISRKKATNTKDLTHLRDYIEYFLVITVT